LRLVNCFIKEMMMSDRRLEIVYVVFLVQMTRVMFNVFCCSM